MLDLNTIWFLLITVLLIGYAILDGFDLGVGIMHFFTKDEHEKRVSLNSIGPVWDGNEVWLLTGGGALFAAFPIVYATVFSGFYLALMLLLVSLITRAVSLEFRSKVESPKWKKVWDYSFATGSLLSALLFGVAIGNILRGVPIDEKGMYTGTFFGLLNPYSLLIGILNLVLFSMQGAVYLTMKAHGDHQARVIKLAHRLWIAYTFIYILSTVLTVIFSPFLFDNMITNPLFYIFFILLLIAIIYMPIALKNGKFFQAFLASSTAIASMISLMAISLFPRLVPSLTDLKYSLTVYNSSSSDITLKTMLIMALIGMPLVIGYTTFIYRVFKGKVIIDNDSY